MGKLTQKQADELQEAGLLTPKIIKGLKDNNALSEGKKSTKRYMKTGDNAWTSPQFYFEGVSKHTYSKKMTELKTAITEVINKYTTDKK